MLKGKDPKKAAMVSLKACLKGVRHCWPESGARAEEEFEDKVTRILDGDRSFFSFQAAAKAINEMNGRMVQASMEPFDPMLIGLAQKSLLSLAALVDEAREEKTNREMLSELRQYLKEQALELKSGESIYLAFYELVTLARQKARVLPRNKYYGELNQRLLKIIDGDYTAEDIEMAFHCAETILQASKESGGSKDEKVSPLLLKRVASVLPVLAFLRGAPSHLVARWFEIRGDVTRFFSSIPWEGFADSSAGWFEGTGGRIRSMLGAA